MRTFAECMIVAVCALTSTVKALDAIQNEQTLTNLAQSATGALRTQHEFQACWSDRPDPACRENEYLDRSGLIDNETTDAYDVDVNANHCVCRLMPLDCGRGFIWDYLNEECQCVNNGSCPENYYFDYNTCGCVCQNIPSHCSSEQYWSQSHCECRCKFTEYAEPLAPHTIAQWNSDGCNHDIIEDPDSPCSGEDDGVHSYYFSTLESECIIQGVVCPANQYYDGAVGHCLCDHQNCGPNEYFDNGNESCYCRCIPQVCPENYSFNNDQCECDCLEPTGADACADTEFAYQYWSTEDCGCLCRPIGDAPDGKYWDTSKCNWSCAPAECADNGENRQWDFDTCECRCCPSSLCGPDQFYNTLNCTCQQNAQDCAIGNFWYVDEITGDGNCVPTPGFNAGDCDWETEYWSFIINDCALKEVKCAGADKFFNGITGDCEFTEPNPSTGEEGQIWNTATGMYEDAPFPCTDMLYYYDVQVSDCVCRPQVCGNDQIFDYEECTCRCKPEQCPDSFRWSENLCDCVCAAPVAGCDDDEFWADNLCQCVCTQPADVTCATGQYWSHEYCGCLCGPTSEEVQAGQYWNTLHCQFECIVQTCEAGEYFRIDEADTTNCACECLPHQCAETEYWNTETCCCDCLQQDCIVNSVWDVATCSCQCLSIEQAEGVTAESNQYWDISSCTLKCAPFECASPQYFDYDTCACQCEYPRVQDVASNPDKWFSLEECNWVQSPMCQDEWPQKYWDQDTNTCKCFDQECPSPYDWNSTTCTCECDVVDGEAAGVKTDCLERAAYEWNQERCECQLCEVQDCTGFSYDGAVRTRFWNAECCSCQCIPWKPCDENVKWDFETCDCTL